MPVLSAAPATKRKFLNAEFMFRKLRLKGSKKPTLFLDELCEFWVEYYTVSVLCDYTKEIQGPI